MNVVESIKTARNPVLLVGRQGSGKTTFAEQVLLTYPRNKRTRMDTESFLISCKQGVINKHKIVVVDEIAYKSQIRQVLNAAIGRAFKLVMIIQLPPEKIPVIILSQCEIILVPAKGSNKREEQKCI